MKRTMNDPRKYKYLSTCLLATAALLGGASPAFAANALLGTASNFAVLSAAPGGRGAVTCTDSTITGDVGSSGAAASIVQTRCTITGATIAPVSAGVLTAFNRAYDALAATRCDQVLTGTLAGRTLSPGVYCFDAAAELTGTLTLNGGSNDTWLFKIGTQTIGTQTPGALTGTNFSVVMANGASACNVTWWVDAAATMTTSNFLGTILAGAAITATGTAANTETGAPSVPGTFEGRALAKAAVTLTDVAFVGCEGGKGNGKAKCNQGVGNGPEGCDPGNSNQSAVFPFGANSNDEVGGVPGSPGRKGGNSK